VTPSPSVKIGEAVIRRLILEFMLAALSFARTKVAMDRICRHHQNKIAD
jgi:hypothetical protein